MKPKTRNIREDFGRAHGASAKPSKNLALPVRARFRFKTKTAKIWFNGKLLDWEKANIHCMTHGLHYGTGVFEGLRCYATPKAKYIFRMGEHVDRFFRGMQALSMKPAFSKKTVAKAIVDIVKVNKLDDCYIRPFAFYGYGKVGVYPKDLQSKIVILAMPFKDYLGTKPIHVKTSPFLRINASALAPGTKITGFYANAVLSAAWARKNGADESLMLDSRGFVAEGASENLFLVEKKNKKNSLVTPESPDLLPGITRDTILQTAKRLGYQCVVRKVRLEEAYRANEAFFTGTAVEVHPIGKIDGRKIGNGKIGEVTQKISDFYKSLVRGRFPAYEKWLTKI